MIIRIIPRLFAIIKWLCHLQTLKICMFIQVIRGSVFFWLWLTWHYWVAGGEKKDWRTATRSDWDTCSLEKLVIRKDQVHLSLIPNTLLVFRVTCLEFLRLWFQRKRVDLILVGMLFSWLLALQEDLKATVVCTECRNCYVELASPNFIEH